MSHWYLLQTFRLCLVRASLNIRKHPKNGYQNTSGHVSSSWKKADMPRESQHPKGWQRASRQENDYKRLRMTSKMQSQCGYPENAGFVSSIPESGEERRSGSGSGRGGGVVAKERYRKRGRRGRESIQKNPKASERMAMNDGQFGSDNAAIRRAGTRAKCDVNHSYGPIRLKNYVIVKATTTDKFEYFSSWTTCRQQTSAKRRLFAVQTITLRKIFWFMSNQSL